MTYSPYNSTAALSPVEEDSNASQTQQAGPGFYTVSQLTNLILYCLEQVFPKVIVRGELSDIHIRSNMLFATIKDANSSLACVGFSCVTQRAVQLKLAQGMSVELTGRISVYKPDGKYQLQIDTIRLVGDGELYQQYLEARKRLADDGLFNPARKRPLPLIPTHVGLITAKGGAAIGDFLQTLNRRCNGLPVRLVTTRIQGKNAVAEIIDALRIFNDTHACDVIVITRGGGSKDDLWTFNDETLARAVAASSIPVLSAVGHDRDQSLCDLVADDIAATPTAAAERLARGKAELMQRLQVSVNLMVNAISRRLSMLEARFNKAQACPYLNRPEDWLKQLRQTLTIRQMELLRALPRLADNRASHLDELHMRLNTAMQSTIATQEQRLARIPAALHALNPRLVLNRGYGIVLNEKGHALLRADEAPKGTKLTILLHDGTLKSTVDEAQTTHSNQ